jgi:hypothetical protein
MMEGQDTTRTDVRSAEGGEAATGDASRNEYHFITHWTLDSTPEEITEILGDAPGLARWWPSVYLRVDELESGDVQGVGKVVDLYTKGWLPYTLRWQFTVTEARNPYGFTLVASGDFVGRGTWTFQRAERGVRVTYDWKIRADKPLLKYGSFLMKPLFAWNHRWAMRQGEESLRLELRRRHAATAAERAAVPSPPGATQFSPLWMLVGATALLVLAGRIRRSKRMRGEAR